MVTLYRINYGQNTNVSYMLNSEQTNFERTVRENGLSISQAELEQLRIDIRDQSRYYRNYYNAVGGTGNYIARSIEYARTRYQSWLDQEVARNREIARCQAYV